MYLKRMGLWGMALKRVTMNFEDFWLKKVDDYAASMGVNRTAAITMLVSMQLEQQKALSVLDRIASMDLKGDGNSKDKND